MAPRWRSPLMEIASFLHSAFPWSGRHQSPTGDLPWHQSTACRRSGPCWLKVYDHIQNLADRFGSLLDAIGPKYQSHFVLISSNINFALSLRNASYLFEAHEASSPKGIRLDLKTSFAFSPSSLALFLR